MSIFVLSDMKIKDSELAVNKHTPNLILFKFLDNTNKIQTFKFVAIKMSPPPWQKSP